MKPIPDLSPEELRVEIAESRGWTYFESSKIGKPYWQFASDRSKDTYDLPNWPTDANEAPKLADVLAEKGWVWNARRFPGNDYSVEFCKYNEAHSEIVAAFHFWASTLPLAICRAYLAVIRSEAKV